MIFPIDSLLVFATIRYATNPEIHFPDDLWETLVNVKKSFRIRDAQGVYRSINRDTLIESAKQCVLEQFKSGFRITSPVSAESYVRTLLLDREHEIFAVLFLDNRHQVIDYVEMFRGTVDGTSVYPREVVKEALTRNAAAVLLVHNHPSGVSEPSQADERITRRLKAALELVDIRVIDHLIVGKTVTSLAARGMI